jgi:uncharacterized coiled-coil protein SlyX
MSTIQDLFAEMKNMAELEKFAEQQYKTILDLNKKITELNVEISGLKTALSATETSDLKIPEAGEKPSEQMICEVQLALLNNVSMQRELTAEEITKVEKMSKIMLPYRNSAKKEDKPVESKSTATLLELIKNEPNQA